MKKSDLKDGMIVKIGKAIYLVCGDKFLGLNGYLGFENYDENLKIKGNEFENLNINFVYETGCWELGLKDLLSETKSLEKIWERKKEIDWSKVPKWTKVRVKYTKEEKWYNEYFLKFSPLDADKFKATFCDEFSYVAEFDEYYKYCEIHPSVKIKEEWYKE